MNEAQKLAHEKKKKQYAKEWREFRKANDMSQESLASATGLSLRTVQSVELCEHAPGYLSRLRFKTLVEKYDREAQRKQQEAASEPTPS